MKLLSKQFKIKKDSELTVEQIENIIKLDNVEPLRWAIVATEGNCVTVEAVVVSK